MASEQEEEAPRAGPPATDRLRVQIRAAWFGVGSPAPPLVSCPCPECTDLEELLRGCDWRSVDRELAERLEQDLPLMGPHTFRALLPAFLLAALDAQSDVGEFLGYSLEPSDFNTPRFEGLHQAQGAAVLAFLRLDLEDCERSNPVYADGPRRAIEEYWCRFEDA